RTGGGAADPHLRAGRPPRTRRLHRRRRAAGRRRPAKRRPGAVRLVDGGSRHHRCTAARRQPGGVAGRRPAGGRAGRPLPNHPFGGRRGAVGRAAARRGAGDRQRAHRPVPAARTDRRGRTAARRGAGRPGRIRRIRAIQAGAHRPSARHGVPGGAGSPRRQRHGRGRRQRNRGRQRMTPRGTLWGVGLGPGDPELVTVKAARVIGEADVVAYHSARHGRSIARGIAERYLRPDQIEEHLVYPVTTEVTDHPGGYAGALEDFYAEAARRIAAHLDAGRNVALLAEGDPLFYSSYMHLHTRLTERFNAVIVPGVTSVSAASAAIATPLVAGDEVLSVLPGTLPVDELTRRLGDVDAAVVLKLGRSYHNVREALSASGHLDDAFY